MPETPEEKMLKEELGKVASIAAVSSSEGGKLLVQTLLQDVVGCVDALGGGYRKLSHMEMVALCADMKSKLDMARVLVRSVANKEMIEEELKSELESALTA